MGHAFSYQAMLLSFLKAQIGSRFPPPDLGLEIRFSLKVVLILNLFSRQKKQKNSPQGPEKTITIDPEIHKTGSQGNIDFRNTFLAETSILESPTSKFRLGNG